MPGSNGRQSGGRPRTIHADEEVLIRAVTDDPGLFYAVSGIVGSVDAFLDPDARAAWRRLSDAEEAGKPLRAAMAKAAADGDDWIADAMADYHERVARPAAIAAADRIRARRVSGLVAGNLTSQLERLQAGDEDPERIARDAVEELTDLVEASTTGELGDDWTPKPLALDVADWVAEQRDTRGKGTRIGSTWRRVNGLLENGLEPGELTILAGSPNVGKTSFCLEYAQHLDTPSILFQLDSGRTPLVRGAAKTFAQLDEVMLTSQFTPYAEVERGLELAVERLADRVRVAYPRRMTPLMLRRAIEREKTENGVVFFFVDHLNRIDADRKTSSLYERTTTVVDALKSITNELQVVLVVVAHLNRESRKEGRRPCATDLRDSGAIEQNADNILMLHRSVSNPASGAKRPKDDQDGVTYLYLDKTRGRAKGTVELRWDSVMQRYTVPRGS